MSSRNLHSDFLYHLDFHKQSVAELFKNLRHFVLNLYPDSNELLYHTHVLSAVYSLSDQLKDGFCHIPVYTNHVNLGFNKGALLDDPEGLLHGTGKLIRHIPIRRAEDYDNESVKSLLRAAVNLAMEDMDQPVTVVGKTISKIKT